MEWVDNKTALTRTGGFLKGGFSHTLNPYVGCSYGGSLCGVFCYAQHNAWITRGRSWRLYGGKRRLCDAYGRDYDGWKKKGSAGNSPLLSIFMSSVTDPYVPQEVHLELTRSLLTAMCERPPDVLVLQTHGTLIERDLDLIGRLSRVSELWVSVTVETDMDRLQEFPPHAAPPKRRIEVLRTFKAAGVRTQATVSPMLPLADPRAFARLLDRSCDRVILDHYVLGDGSGGARTRRTDFEKRLQRAGYGEWMDLEKLWEIRGIFSAVLGEERVLISREGFNAVGPNRSQSQSPGS